MTNSISRHSHRVGKGLTSNRQGVRKLKQAINACQHLAITLLRAREERRNDMDDVRSKMEEVRGKKEDG